MITPLVKRISKAVNVLDHLRKIGDWRMKLRVVEHQLRLIARAGQRKGRSRPRRVQVMLEEAGDIDTAWRRPFWICRSRVRQLPTTPRSAWPVACGRRRSR